MLDYLMPFVSNLSVSGIDSITLQSATLAELTKSTSALTRDAMVRYVLSLLKRSAFATRTRSLHRHIAKN